MSFEEFWRHYPRKVATGAARKAFERLSEADQAKAIAVIPAQAQAWVGKPKKWIPHATTWLNQQRFEDEIELTEREQWTAALYGHERSDRHAIRSNGSHLDAGGVTRKMAG